MTCIRGCRGREWTLLPCEMVNGRLCVQVSAKAFWLRHCLGLGAKSKMDKVHVRDFIFECVGQFKRQEVAVSQAESSGLEPSAASNAVAGRKRILDSDDEEQMPGHGFEPSAAAVTKKRVRTRRCHPGEFVRRLVRQEFNLTYTVTDGRKLWLPVDERGVHNVIDHLASWIAKAGFEPSPDFPSLLAPEERRFIGWRWAPHLTHGPNHGTWYMRCQTSGGKEQILRQSYHVPRCNLAGCRLTTEQALEAARQVLQRVKVAWNRMDKSDNARLVI